MINYIYSLRIAIALLIVVMTVTIGAGIPISAHAADSIGRVTSADDERKIKIRKEEEKDLKLNDESFRNQAKSLAEEYRKTAEIVAKQGGDPKPLLAAAAYFESQSK